MPETNNKKKPNPVWNFFRSIKLTILLLILLATASIIGTVIPQVPQRESFEFAGSLSPEVFRFFNSLNLFDMYHSLWFRFLMGCLVLNLVICSLDRFPGTWRLFRSLPKPDRSRPFENLPPEQAFSVKGNSEITADRVEQFLKKHYRKTLIKRSPDKSFYYSEKGGHSRFGVYIVHTSVLLILIGALVGSYLGFEAFVNIREGETTNIVKLRRGMNQSLELGFGVRCDEFSVTFHENGTPREFRSELTFLVDENEVEKTSLLVNHPARFMGITFYQSTYGTIPGKKVRLRISRGPGKNQSDIIEVETGKFMPLPGGEGKFSIAGVEPDFMNKGPAVRVAVLSDNGKERTFWVFQEDEKIRKMLPKPMRRSPKFDPSACKPYTFFLEGLETSYYTGLQVNKDPGVPIVWAGCFLIIAGFIVTFFTSHMRIWVRVINTGHDTNISVAGTTNRNPVVFERELMRLINDLKDLSGD